MMTRATHRIAPPSRALCVTLSALLALSTLPLAGCWTGQHTRPHQARPLVVERDGVSARVARVDFAQGDTMTRIHLRVINRSDHTLLFRPERARLLVRERGVRQPVATPSPLNRRRDVVRGAGGLGSPGVCLDGAGLGSMSGAPAALPMMLLFGVGAVLIIGTTLVVVSGALIASTLMRRARARLEPGEADTVTLELAEGFDLDDRLAHPSAPVLLLDLSAALRREGDDLPHSLGTLVMVDRDDPHLGYERAQPAGAWGLRLVGAKFFDGPDGGVAMPGYGGLELHWGPRLGDWSVEGTVGLLGPLGMDARRHIPLPLGDTGAWSLIAGLGYGVHYVPFGAHGPRVSAELAWTPQEIDWTGHRSGSGHLGIMLRGGPTLVGPAMTLRGAEAALALTMGF